MLGWGINVEKKEDAIKVNLRGILFNAVALLSLTLIIVNLTLI